MLRRVLAWCYSVWERYFTYVPEPDPVESTTKEEGVAKPYRKVVYVGDGGKEHLAFVYADKGDKADLFVLGSGEVNDVPRRAKADYGPEGGGHTWHEIG